jgi:hypothetical protein
MVEFGYYEQYIHSDLIQNPGKVRMDAYIGYKRDVILYEAVGDDLWLPMKRNKSHT